MIQRLKDALKELNPLNTMIIGIGNTLRCDDGAGSVIASRLIRLGHKNVIDAGTVPENYIGKVLLAHPSCLIFIDAIAMGEKPGNFRILDIDNIYDGDLSTHGTSLKMLVDVFNEEKDLKVFVLGIEPDLVKMGDGLSEKISASADEITEALNEWLKTGL